MNQNLKLWLRAANPMTPPRAMIEAQRSARVGAFALVIGTLQQVVFLILRPDRGAAEAAMALQMEAQDMPPIEAEMAGAIADWVVIATTIVSAGFAVLCLVLAVVQWRKMTWLIPAAMLAFTVYGLLAGLGGLAVNPELIAAMHEANPSHNPAVMGVGWAIQLLIAILCFVALRGGRLLARLERAF